MKTLIALALSIVLLLAPGCAILQTDGKLDPAKMATAANLAAYQGTFWYLRAKPEHRESFVIAANALEALIAAGDFSPETFHTVLAMLPIKELKTVDGDAAVIVDTVFILWRAYGRQVDVTIPENVAPVMQGVLDGIRLAL